MLSKIFKSSLLLVLSTLFSKMFMFVVNIFVGRFVTIEMYGQYAMLRSSINLIETTVSAAINPMVIKISSEENDDDIQGELFSAIFLTSFIVILLISVPCLFLANSISLFLFDGAIKMGIVYSIIVAGLTILNGILISTFISRFRYLNIFISSFVSALLTSPISYYLIVYFSIEGAIFSLLIFQVFDMMIKGYFVISNDYFKSIFGKFKESCFNIINLLFKTSLILLASSMINAITFWGVRYILSIQNDGYIELAKFDVSYQFIVIEFLVLNSLTTVMLPMLVKNFTAGNDTKNLLFFNLIIAVVSACTMSGIIYFTSPYLLSFFGDKYDDIILKLMSVIPVLYALSIVFNRYALAINKRNVLFYVALISALIMFWYTLTFVHQAADLVNAFVIYYGTSCIVYILFFLNLMRFRFEQSKKII